MRTSSATWRKLPAPSSLTGPRSTLLCWRRVCQTRWDASAKGARRSSRSESDVSVSHFRARVSWSSVGLQRPLAAAASCQAPSRRASGAHTSSRWASSAWARARASSTAAASGPSAVSRAWASSAGPTARPASCQPDHASARAPMSIGPEPPRTGGRCEVSARAAETAAVSSRLASRRAAAVSSSSAARRTASARHASSRVPVRQTGHGEAPCPSWWSRARAQQPGDPVGRAGLGRGQLAAPDPRPGAAAR